MEPPVTDTQTVFCTSPFFPCIWIHFPDVGLAFILLLQVLQDCKAQQDE